MAISTTEYYEWEAGLPHTCIVPAAFI